MSKPIDDGGPAFPDPRQYPMVTGCEAKGMTLRDYFAAKAMQAMVGAYRDTLKAESPGESESTSPCRDLMLDKNHITGVYEGAAEIAADSYIIADAMLAARAVKP